MANNVNIAGSADWMKANLSTEDFQTMVRYFNTVKTNNPVIYRTPGSSGWLITHLNNTTSANSYNDLYTELFIDSSSHLVGE
jgi:hypothetical protein